MRRFSQRQRAGAGDHWLIITSSHRNKFFVGIQALQLCAVILDECNFFYYLPFNSCKIRETMYNVQSFLDIFKACHKSKALVKIRSNRSPIRRGMEMAFSPKFQPKFHIMLHNFGLFVILGIIRKMYHVKCYSDPIVQTVYICSLYLCIPYSYE